MASEEVGKQEGKMASEEGTTNKKTRRNKNNRGCTKRKCIVITCIFLVLAALVAGYVALVCQRMHLSVVDARILAFNLASVPVNSSISVSSQTSRVSISSQNSRVSTSSQSARAPILHVANMGANSSKNASMPTSVMNSSYYLIEVALTLSLLVRNPTPHVGTYHYHQLNWQIVYGNITVAECSVLPFSQGPHHTRSPIEVHLKGANIALSDTIASDLQTSQRSLLKLRARTTVYVDLLKKVINYKFPVYCDLVFPHPRDSKDSCVVMAG